MILSLAGALLILSGCMRTELAPLSGEEGIRVTLNCGEIGTRTDPSYLPGEGNENLIKSVDYFLFSSDDSFATDGTCTYTGHLEPKVTSDFTFYIQTAVANVATGKTYKVYTIVNYPASRRDDLDASQHTITMAYLQGLDLDETTDETFTDYDDGKYATAGKNLSLVMVGTSAPFTVSAAELNGSSGSLAKEVPVKLQRLPAKVTMDFYIKDKIVRDEEGVAETWTPMTDGANIRAYLCNAAGSVKLAFPKMQVQVADEEVFPVLNQNDANATPLIFSYQPSLDNTAIAGKEEEGYSKAFRSESFYTYPRKWNLGDKEEPYLKLIVPWKVKRVVNGETTESQKEFYYKVMLPKALAGGAANTEDGKGFIRNNWYQLSVDVDRLGSATDDGAVTVECDYQVVPWGAPQQIPANLVEGLYLDVNEGDYEVEFYGDQLELPFFSSGPVSYEVRSTYYNVFRAETVYVYSYQYTDPTDGSTKTDKVRTLTPFGDWVLKEEIKDENDVTTAYVYNVYDEYKESLVQIRVPKDQLTSETPIDYSAGNEKPFQGEDDISLSNEEKYLSVYHKLDIDYSTRGGYVVAFYVYEITLKLNGHFGEFDKKVKIIQYPSLYLGKDRSGHYYANDGINQATRKDPVIIRAYSYNSLTNNSTPAANRTTAVQNHNIYAGNTAQNTALSSTNKSYYMGSIQDPSQITNSGMSTNQNIFLVNATIMKKFEITIDNQQVDVVIGDPRVEEGVAYKLPNASSDFNFALADLYDSSNHPNTAAEPNNSKEWYRPTANNTKNVIAPQFRIASSFGKTNAMMYEGAVRRCAAYQENGYPAGRWRLPTMAEIQFLIRLYNDGKIDQLFEPDSASGYWAGGEMARFGDWFEDMSSYRSSFVHNGTFQFDPVTDPVTGNTTTYSPTTGVCVSFTHDGVTKNRAAFTRCVYDTWYWGDEKGKYMNGNTLTNYDPANPVWLGYQTTPPQS